MEYIGNYIVAGLIAIVALVALVQTAISRRSDRWSRPRLTETEESPDDSQERSYQKDVHDQQKRPR